MNMQHNNTDAAIVVSWCVNADHWSGSPGVHDESAEDHVIASHTITPGSLLYLGTTEINADAIFEKSANLGLTLGE
jgi:hypothetical protein